MTRLKIKLPSRFTFSTEVRVRVNDINYAGHLSNDKVLTLMHEARVRYLDKYGFTELDIAGRGTIMTEAMILFKSEAFYGDTLRIDVTVDEFHKYGCCFFYKFSNKETGREVATAKTGMVFFDYKKRKIIEVPEQFIEACAPKNR
ncbi:MAG: acyl-CoA thioesterase [bacterium]